jgi:hypothetical protein
LNVSMVKPVYVLASAGTAYRNQLGLNEDQSPRFKQSLLFSFRRVARGLGQVFEKFIGECR